MYGRSTSLVLRCAAAAAIAACIGACGASSRIDPIINYVYYIPESGDELPNQVQLLASLPLRS